MRLKRFGIAVFALILLAGAVPLNAAEKLVYKQGIFAKVFSGGNTWVNCGFVSITPPEDGAVVVTMSGMVGFDDTLSDLALTIAIGPAKRGLWVFGVTPGYQLVQSFSIRRVFQVQANKTVKYFLNAASFNGPGHAISIQTGSMTAEFYATQNVQQLTAPALNQSEKTDDPRSNAY